MPEGLIERRDLLYTAMLEHLGSAVRLLWPCFAHSSIHLHVRGAVVRLCHIVPGIHPFVILTTS